MSEPTTKVFRKRRLFPRALDDVVKEATKPLMNKQGKVYGALLRDWAQIVGTERAAVTRPDRLQFPTNEANGATLHILARPAAAPELAYATEQMLEQCARYFGFRAVNRIVIHASHDVGASQDMTEQKPAIPKKQHNAVSSTIPATAPTDMRDVLNRIAQHVSPSDKKN
jgi:hypothetical protein